MPLLLLLELKYFLFFTFRTNTFPLWPDSLSIFEIFVSKSSYFGVIVLL